MKRTFEKITGTIVSVCLLIPAVLVSCKKEIPPLSISFSIPSAGIAIQQGETADIPYTVNNIPEGGGEKIDLSVKSDNDDFTVTVTASDDTGASGTISVQAPELLYNPCTVNISVTATVTATGETAAANISISAVMYEGYEEISSPANCHIVKPGSFVKIPANTGNTSEKASFTEAGLLWQDAQGLVSSVTADSENGAVYVLLAPGKEGNAVISVTDGSGNVSWSWHLWVTDFDPEATAMEWTGTAGSYLIMDRYLGALSNDPQSDLSNGLFYQWGRKDPFPASNHDNELNTMYDMAGATLEKTVEKCSAENNIANSIANPLTHYSGANSAGDWSWLTTSSSFLASDTVKDLWGGVSGNKSEYDPCPDGWQVISADAWGFVNDENTSAEIVYNTGSETQENKDQVGRMFTVGGKNYFFPSQGEVVHGGTYQNGIGSNYPCGRAWSSTLNESNRPMNLGVSPSSLSFPYTSIGMGYELPVRCMKLN